LVNDYRRKLRIWESGYGREGGWVIERQGQPIAVLTECRFHEMFWDSYRLQPVAGDLVLRERMQTPEFWEAAGAEGLVWRSREFGDVAEHAFPAGSPFPAPGRLLMRGLYLSTSDPWPWDRLLMWWRRRLQHKAEPSAAPDGDERS